MDDDDVYVYEKKNQCDMHMGNFAMNNKVFMHQRFHGAWHGCAF